MENKDDNNKYHSKKGYTLLYEGPTLDKPILTADKMTETLKPRKEIIKIFNKLIEQFKNITKKDFKRLKTYVISGKDEYYHIKYNDELNMVLHYMKLNLPTGTTLVNLDNLIVDIRRIILEGKPTIKFNLNIEEFKLFKKWLLDNSERIEDGN